MTIGGDGQGAMAQPRHGSDAGAGVRGKTALITGATSGIGLETAVSLASAGATVILVGRDPQRLALAAARVRASAGVDADARLCDQSSLDRVRQLADNVRRDHSNLHILINNAGAVHKRRVLTVDGIEATFAVNHLSHFLLTTLLLDLLIASAPARVVTVASIGHRRGTLDFNDLGFSSGYGVMRAYSRSKLANVLFASELARRLAGTGVTSNSVHPGGVATRIWAGAPLWAQPYIRLWLWRSLVSVEEGAVPLIQLVTRPDLDGVSGRYFEGLWESEPAPLARDAKLAARLWQESERLVEAHRA